MIRALRPWEIEFVCSSMKYQPTDGIRSVANVDEKGQILSACLYDHWAHTSVNVHIWSRSAKGLFDPSFVREIFTYPFISCDRSVLLCLIPSDGPAVPVAKVLGFCEAYRVKDGWDRGIDLLLMELQRDKCRYIELKKAA